MVREIGIIGYYIMMLRFFCSIFQVLVVQLYICFEKQAIQYKKALIMFGIAACIYNLIILVGEGEINFVTILVLSISIIIMAISGLIFIYVLNQIFEGRFSVKVNQVFGMANVFNFGLLFPCNF
ncbi:unnamed protein product [Paramecium octaurelia]|uniref:Uncharacterized protein n=1 Tax=Paramecium octaurelia TaxID=43137 RepID=A0A8S1SEK0_PAROT|nr:unnamed protein product [Paramecium octaurelia]CAD8138717.1 unnamed protein product [Paramecium octaurelia]